MKTLKGHIFDTCKGWMGVAASDRGIAAVTHPCAQEAEARQALEELCPNGLDFERTEQDSIVGNFADKVVAFFEGQRVEFDEQVDLDGVSPFHRQVLELVRTIPYGEVRSYGWVAQQLGRPRAARAVGQALHRNPVPIIIPCHRVIASNGSLRGFGWGLEFKEWLIGLEQSKSSC